MFKFDFKLDDDTDDDKTAISNDSNNLSSTNLSLDPFAEHSLSQLVRLASIHSLTKLIKDT